MQIEILNWAKFNNPRKDVKSTSWFRFQNDFFTHPDFCDLPHDQKLVFPYLCSVASARMSGVFHLSESLACKILNVSLEAFEAATNHLQKCGIIKIPAARTRNGRVPRARNARVSKSYRNGTDGTDGTDITNTPGRDAAVTESPPRLRPVPELDPADLAVAAEWLEHALTEMPWKRDDARWTVEAFAADIARVRKATGAVPEGMAALLAFIRADDFWRKNACSPRGLLKRSERNGERKIDNILVRMRTPADRQLETIRRWAEKPDDPGRNIFDLRVEGGAG